MVRTVATPQLSTKGDNIELFVTITSPISAGEAKIDPETGKAEKPVFSCKVTDLTDGVEKSLVTAAILRSELTRTYPEHSYVGKSFAFKKGAPAPGKPVGRQYNLWQMVEIDISAAKIAQE